MNMKRMPNFTTSDENPGYWQETPSRQRDAKILDRHFEIRAKGGEPVVRTSSARDNYIVPHSQKVILRENKQGGLPEFSGRVQNISRTYLQAQNMLMQQNDSVTLQRVPTNSMDNIPEIDAGPLLFQRMMNQSNNTIASNQNPMVQPQTRICQLNEGYIFYTSLNTGNFGTNTQLVKKGGSINQVFLGKQFQIEGIVQCYLIDGLQTIDLQRPEPQRMLNLIKISAPLTGTYLVPQEAIIESNQNSRQLLTDQARDYIRNQGNNQQLQTRQLLTSPGQLPQNRNVLQPQQYPQRPVMSNQNHIMDQRQVLQQQSANLLKKRGLLKG